jgi:hypothetical protein
VVLEEPLQGLPFRGDGDKIFFIYLRRGICHRKRLRPSRLRGAVIRFGTADREGALRIES